MRGNRLKRAYPEGFADWEIAQIEALRESNPMLHEWRKVAHLEPVRINTYTVIDRRPIDRPDATQ